MYIHRDRLLLCVVVTKEREWGGGTAVWGIWMSSIDVVHTHTHTHTDITFYGFTSQLAATVGGWLGEYIDNYT